MNNVPTSCITVFELVEITLGFHWSDKLIEPTSMTVFKRKQLC